jgi:hypothetical protein
LKKARSNSARQRKRQPRRKAKKIRLRPDILISSFLISG